jgi:hypothetical protein
MRIYKCAAMITCNVTLSRVILAVVVRVSAMAATSAAYDIPRHSTALIMLGEEQTYEFTQFLMFDIFALLE